MPEPQDPDGNQGDDGSVGNSTIQKMREQIKNLEKQAKQAEIAEAERDALKAELSSFQRNAIFDRLNIPPTGAGKLLRDTYTGDATEEAIAAHAAQYGIIKEAQPAQTSPTIPGVDQEAWQRMQQSLSGPATAPPTTAHEAINGAQDVDSLLTLLRGAGVVVDT